jgi:nickel-dependent lactate racemase
MLYFAEGGLNKKFDIQELEKHITEILTSLGDRKRVLIIPPDFTRYHSAAGIITQFVYKYYDNKVAAILPALGTHFPMTDKEIVKMFGDIPRKLFIKHDWRNDITTLGRVPAEYLAEVSEGRVNYDWPAQVNRLLVEGGFDLILSIGQVVPHEVIGMANYNKNIFVGTGGAEGINKSHFLGAAYGLERIMGRADTPVRKVLDYASEHFAKEMPVVYIQTVNAKDENGITVIKGLYAGDDRECFDLASELSLKVNFQLLDKELKKVIVYLDPEEFKTTWLGNKSIYRTRMAIADGGELIVLAPGLKQFGEDPEIDKLIRKYGYLTSKEILQLTVDNEDLSGNLSAAAHLIHGSAEDRFKITYCPGNLTKEEIESVNYNYEDLPAMQERYDPFILKDGFNILPDGEEIYFISNPALGLWSFKDRFVK